MHEEEFPPNPLSLDELALIRQRIERGSALREQLHEHGFTDTGTAHYLQVNSLEAFLRNAALIAHAHHLDPRVADDAAGLLTTLLLCNDTVDAADYVRIIGSRLRRELAALDLIMTSRSAVAARVSIVPTAHRILLSDQIFSIRGDRVLFQDSPVMPAHASTFLLLDRLDQSTRSQSMVDLGCGSGYLGLSQTDDDIEVLGVDTDPRAIEFFRLNATLNQRKVRWLSNLDQLGESDRSHYRQLCFNSPAGPIYDPQADRYTTSPLWDWVELASTTAELTMAPGGAVTLFLVQARAGHNDNDDIAALQDRLRQAHPRLAITAIDEVDDPHFRVAQDEIAAGHFDGRSIWLRSRQSHIAFMDYLDRAGIESIVPLIVRMQLR